MQTLALPKLVFTLNSALGFGIFSSAYLIKKMASHISLPMCCKVWSSSIAAAITRYHKREPQPPAKLFGSLGLLFIVKSLPTRDAPLAPTFHDT